MSKAKTILVFSDWYLPGFKGGGTIRAVASLIHHLKEEINIKIITRDRDRGDSVPYKNIVIDRWQNIDNVQILYCSPSQLSTKNIVTLIQATKHELLYLNSLFSYRMGILPLIINRLQMPEIPCLLAPRGQLFEGALNVKFLKKRAFLYLSRFSNIYRHIQWHATTEYEADAIRLWYGQTNQITVSPDLITTPSDLKNPKEFKTKCRGKLKIVLITRIAENKNIEGAISLLSEIKGDVIFHIFGPIENQKYWHKCLNIIKSLPENISVEHKGLLKNSHVISTMQAYDLFFLPTFGENYGYSLLEALFAGCPILISDLTPWQNLESTGIGWDIPLSRQDLFRKKLQDLANMDKETYLHFSSAAFNFAKSLSENTATIDLAKNLFLNILKNA